MLNTIRGFTKSWSSKAIIILLAGSFAVWGISDVFRSGGSDTVATVGETEIPARNLAREYRSELQRLQSRFPEFTGEQAQEIGLPQQILGRLVDQALIAEEARASGMMVPDAILAQRIVSENPGLLANGEFDRVRYETALQRSGQTLESFEEGVRVAILRQQVIDAVAGIGRAPQALAETLAKHNQERRDAVLALVTPGNAASTTPDDTAVQAYYEAHPELYTAPEYRRVTLLELTTEAVAAEIELSDDDIFAEYEDRIGEFEQPERRSAVQVLSSDEALIRDLAAAVAAGTDFETASGDAKAAGATVSEFASLTRGNVPAEAADALFSAQQGSLSAPVKTAFGWHIFLVREVRPAGTQPFDEVRAQLLEEMTADIAIDSLYGLAGVIEDTLAGDGSLEDAAAAVAVEPIIIEGVDASGRARDGSDPLGGVMAAGQVVQAAFETPDGAMSDLRETPDGTYFLLRVDGIEEQAVRPLIDIREQVVADWQSQAGDDAARLAAEELAGQVKSGVPLIAAAREQGYPVETFFDLTRGGEPADVTLSPEIVSGLFTADPEAGEPIVGASEAGYVVAVVTARHAADAEAVEADTRANVLALAQSRQSDMLLMFRSALHARHEITVDGRTFEALFATP